MTIVRPAAKIVHADVQESSSIALPRRLSRRGHSKIVGKIVNTSIRIRRG